MLVICVISFELLGVEMNRFLCNNAASLTVTSLIITTSIIWVAGAAKFCSQSKIYRSWANTTSSWDKWDRKIGLCPPTALKGCGWYTNICWGAGEGSPSLCYGKAFPSSLCCILFSLNTFLKADRWMGPCSLHRPEQESPDNNNNWSRQATIGDLLVSIEE